MQEKKKELVYFYDIDRPDNSRDIVNLSLHECLFPVEGSRRVNFDEAVRKVCYKIENKRTLPSFTGFIYICEYFDITLLLP